MTESTGESIRDAAEILNDREMLVRIAGIDLKTKGVKYHHSCKREYLNNANRASKLNSEVMISDKSALHLEAFNTLKNYIQKNLIDISSFMG